MLETPFDPEQEDKGYAQRITLVKLYVKAGRMEEAARLLNSMDVERPDVVWRRAFIHSAMLVLGSVSISPANADEFERDIAILTSDQHAASMPLDVGVGPIQDRADAVGVLAWYLTCYFAAQQEGAHALRILRSAQADVLRTSALSAQIGSTLPPLLASLWRMAGALDDDMMRDFSTLVLPLVNPETRASVYQMLDSVWQWEALRGGPLHLAAPSMSLMICESALQSGGDASGNGALGNDIFHRLAALDAWNNRGVTRLVARSLAIIVQAAAADRDESVVHVQIPKLLDDLHAAGRYNAALQVMVDLVELLLDAHMSTQNQWFYGVIKTLASRLRPLQELSDNNFDEVTHLINVYLQSARRYCRCRRSHGETV